MSSVLAALDELFPRWRYWTAAAVFVVGLWAFGHAFALEFRITRRR